MKKKIISGLVILMAIGGVSMAEDTNSSKRDYLNCVKDYAQTTATIGGALGAGVGAVAGGYIGGTATAGVGTTAGIEAGAATGATVGSAVGGFVGTVYGAFDCYDSENE